MEKNKKINTYDLVVTAMFTVLSIIGAYIKIPIGTVPFTLQFMIAALSGIILGSKFGPLSQIIYIILGLIGLPVFTSGGGITYIFYPTFGYIIGFVICSFMIGFACERMIKKYNKINKIKLFIILILSMFVVYTVGAIYFYMIKNIYLKTEMDFLSVVKVCFIPFIFSDFIYCIILGAFGPKLKSIINKIKS